MKGKALLAAGALLPAMFVGAAAMGGQQCGTGNVPELPTRATDKLPGFSYDEKVRADQQKNAAIIVGVGLKLGIPRDGIIIAVATSKVETDLLNLPNEDTAPSSLDYDYDTYEGGYIGYGDHDSMGLFQQRDSYGTVAQRMDREWATETFFTGGHRGYEEPGLKDIDGWQDMPMGDAAQAVQVSAYPGRYATQMPFATRVVGALLEGQPLNTPVAVDSSCEPATSGPVTDQAAYERVVYHGAEMDAYTKAALQAAERRLGYELTVTQGSYSTGVSASAGTHDGGGVVDLSAENPAEVVPALWDAGFCAWYRTPAEGPWPAHIHAVQVGNRNLSSEAKDQVTSCKAGGDGLAGTSTDSGKPPPEVFPWPPSQVQAAR